jgi:hypothetical protein
MTKFAMTSAGDVSGDLHVIRLVGQDEARGDAVFQQSSQNLGIGRVAAHDAMQNKLENIPDPGDCDCGVGLERPLLQSIADVAENHMIDLGRREPGDLNWRIRQDQLFELDLQRVEIPLSLFRQAIDRQSEDALLVWAQMLDTHARDPIEAQLFRRLVPHFAVNEFVAAAD